MGLIAAVAAVVVVAAAAAAAAAAVVVVVVVVVVVPGCECEGTLHPLEWAWAGGPQPLCIWVRFWWPVPKPGLSRTCATDRLTPKSPSDLLGFIAPGRGGKAPAVSYTHLRAHET